MPDEEERDGQGATAAPADDNAAGTQESERKRQRRRDLDAHDRMMARRAADAARDTLHDSTPFEQPGSYTVYEARDRAAHTPSLAREMERNSNMARETKSLFTEQERYILDVQQRKDLAALYPDSEEGRWLRERERLAEANPHGPEARQVAEEAQLEKLYSDAPQGAGPEGQNTIKEAPKDVTPEEQGRVDQALGKIELSDKIGGATDAGAKPTPNDPTPIDKSREVGQDLQRQGVSMDKDK
jgi:hypothetical protein